MDLSSAAGGYWRTVSLVRALVFLLVPSHGAAQSCGPRVSARLLAEIPCDMSENSYCTAPGSAYPWQSVKRYIFDNQGLVRRMYGDERHNIILSKEMSEYRLRYNPHFLEPKTIVRYGRGRAVRGRTKPRRRQSRPQIFTDDPPTRFTSDPTPTEETIFRIVTQTSIKIGGSTTSRSSLTTAGTDTSDIRTDLVANTTTAPTTTGESTTTTMSTEVTEETTEFPYYDADTSVPGHVSYDANSTASVSLGMTASTFETSVMDTYVSTDAITDDPGPSALERTRFDDEYDYGERPKRKYVGFSHNSVEEKNKNKDYGSDEDYETRGETPEDLMMEETEDGEADVEKQEETVPKRGINACPVKNEVIAPYWANNTRGETLALLNVYPFEQYVHFEKCAFENHQMLCREGCRCEQQYRLHRLLAFDPKNECRGIFSDWFRFPSCCVCICYDITPDVPRTRSRTGRM